MHLFIRLGKYILIMCVFMGIYIVYKYGNSIIVLKQDTLKVIDAVNPMVGKLSLNQYTLPTFNIILSKKDVKKLDKTINQSKLDANIYHPKPYMSNYNNDFTKVKIKYLGESYKGKLRFHGTDFPHFEKDKKSFFIKLNKDKLIHHSRRFSFIILEQNSLATIFSNLLYKKYLNFNIQTFLCRVEINGIDQGLYLFEEKLHKSLLEKNGLTGVDIIKPFDEWNYQYRRNGATNPFYRNIANSKFKNLSKKELNQLVKYEYLFSDNDIDNIKKIIDVKKFAFVEALRILFGDAHQVSGENYKLLYDTSRGLFLPFFRTEDVLINLKLDKNSALFENSINPKDNKLLRRLVQDDDFRNLRNHYLSIILEDKSQILELFNNIINKNQKIIMADSSNNYSSYYQKKLFQIQKNALINNFKEIEAYLTYTKVFVDFRKLNKNKYLLNIVPDSNCKLGIEKFDINTTSSNIWIHDMQTNDIKKVSSSKIQEYFISKNYSLGLNKNLSILPHNYSYEIYSNNDLMIHNFNIKFLNLTLNKKIKGRDVKTVLINLRNDHEFSFNYLNLTLDTFLTMYQKIHWLRKGKVLIMKKGDYILRQNMIFPYGYSLVIEQGTKLKISNKKSILVYGGIDIQGTEDEPVVISNLEQDKPFGVVAALGNEFTSCNINYLEIYGGNDAYINGSYFSGAISFYSHKRVSILNSYVHHNSADDGLNIKNSNIEVSNNIFNANFADQVDLDFCKGVVYNNKFISKSIIKNFKEVTIQKDDNGDGLDFSGSEVIVKNNYYEGFLDKGISVGENTKIFITQNIFKNNRSAVTAKDQSDVYLFGNKYINNQYNIEMYQKKQIFKHPSVYNMNEIYNRNKVTKSLQSHYYKLESNIADINNSKIKNVFEKLSKYTWREYD